MSTKKQTTTAIATLGIDLGKTSCALVGLDASGAVVFKRNMRRTSIPSFTANMPACVIAMEACCGAHYLGRIILAQDHDVRLMPPEYVRPYVKSHKNDERDAEAIAEAATRPTMRFVEVKAQEQLDVQSLHRVRERLVTGRTKLINQMRALLLERGITVPTGRQKLADRLPDILSGEANQLSGRIRMLLGDMRADWRCLDERIADFDREFAKLARGHELTARLMEIPGIGPLTATALIAAVGNAETMERGRNLSAWLGLVPRQATTGGKTKLLGISKRGNKYLRKLLVHGARSAACRLIKTDTPLGAWLRGLVARHHYNVAVVALANKMARIAWVVLTGRGRYDPTLAAHPIN